jgi:hypothetical protein
VVGRHHVEGIVGQRRQQQPGVLSRPQRRVDLGVGIAGGGGLARRLVDVPQGPIAGDPHVVHDQMVRHHLSGDARRLGFRPPHQIDAATGADVADMEPTTGQAGEHQIARDHDLLRLGRDPRQPESRRNLPLVHRAVGQRLVLAMDHD